MLPKIPSLLFFSHRELEEKLLSLVNKIKTNNSKDDTLRRNRFIQEYLHIDKSQVNKIKKMGQESMIMEVQISEKEKEIVKEMDFLSNCIDRQYGWTEIARKINLNFKMSRRPWNYELFLVYQMLRKLPSTLGEFISIKIFNKTWPSTTSVFRDLRSWHYIKKQVNSLLERDEEELRKIDNQFVRNILLSLKLKDGIEATLDRIQFQTLQKSDDKKMELEFERWHDFLCVQFVDNNSNEKPQLKYEKKSCTVKWSKCKVIPGYLRFEYNKKLQRIMSTGLKQAVVSDVQKILIESLQSRTQWKNVRKEIEMLVAKINRVQEEEEVKSQKSQSQYSVSRRKPTSISMNQPANIYYDSDSDFESKYTENTVAKSVKSQKVFRPKRPNLNKSHMTQEKIKNEDINQHYQKIFFKSSPIPKEFVDQYQQVTLKELEETEIQVDRQRSYIQKSIELDDEKGQMLYYLHHLEKEIEVVKQNYFQTTDNKKIDYCFNKNSRPLHQQHHSKYDLFIKQKEFIDNLKNNDMKKILASIVVFKQPVSELQKFLGKGKRQKLHIQNQSQESSFPSCTVKNSDHSLESKIMEVSNRLPNFSKKNTTIRTPLKSCKSWRSKSQSIVI